MFKKFSIQCKNNLQLCCVCISKCKFSVLLVIAFKGFSDKIEVVLSEELFPLSIIEKTLSQNPLMPGKTQEQFQFQSVVMTYLEAARLSRYSECSQLTSLKKKKTKTICTTGSKYITLSLNIKYASLSTDIPYFCLSLLLLTRHNFLSSDKMPNYGT